MEGRKSVFLQVMGTPNRPTGASSCPAVKSIFNRIQKDLLAPRHQANIQAIPSKPTDSLLGQ